jgi:hypothetical protein
MLGVERGDARQVAKLLPLTDSEDAANREQHLGIRLFQVGSRLSNLIDLGDHLRFVGLIGFNQRLQDRFLFLQGSVQIDELQAVILEDLLDLLNLFIADPDFLHQG